MSLGYFEIGSQRPTSIPSLDTLMISPFAAMPGMPSVTTKEAFFISILRSKGCLNKGVPLNEGVPLNSDANRLGSVGRVGSCAYTRYNASRGLNRKKSALSILPGVTRTLRLHPLLMPRSAQYAEGAAHFTRTTHPPPPNIPAYSSTWCAASPSSMSRTSSNSTAVLLPVMMCTTLPAEM